MGWRRIKYQPTHAYVHPEDIPGMTQAAVETRTERVFVVRGEIITAGHPLYRWLLEFEEDFRTRLLERLRERKARAQEIIEQALVDVTTLVTGTVGPMQLASVMIDRARMANKMRPRARVAYRSAPIGGPQLVRRLA